MTDISGYTAIPWLRYVESRHVYSFLQQICTVGCTGTKRLFLSVLSAPKELGIYHETKQELKYSEYYGLRKHRCFPLYSQGHAIWFQHINLQRRLCLKRGTWVSWAKTVRGAGNPAVLRRRHNQHLLCGEGLGSHGEQRSCTDPHESPGLRVTLSWWLIIIK